MNTWIRVARSHLVRPMVYVAVPWLVLAFSFAVAAAIFAMIPVHTHTAVTSHGVVMVPDTGGRYTGALSSVFIVFFVAGIQTIGRALPFGLMLGASRRAFYTGTALLGVSLAFVSGLGVTALQGIERATNGWGLSMHFFRVPYLLDGPWYVTWLTSFVGLSVLFVYGMWYGVVYRRWSLPGLVVFIAAQVLVALSGVAAVTLAHAWSGVAAFFTSLTALGLTGVLAALTALLLAGGHATVRRATV